MSTDATQSTRVPNLRSALIVFLLLAASACSGGDTATNTPVQEPTEQTSTANNADETAPTPLPTSLAPTPTPVPDPVDTTTALTLITSDKRFSIYANALQTTELAELLNGPGPVTLLVPTNESVMAAAEAQGQTVDTYIATNTFTTNLASHIFDQSYSSQRFRDEAGTNNQRPDAFTVDGLGHFIVSFASGLINLQTSARFNEGGSSVDFAGEEITVGNGVVHVIVKPLEPSDEARAEDWNQ